MRLSNIWFWKLFLYAFGVAIQKVFAKFMLYFQQSDDWVMT